MQWFEQLYMVCHNDCHIIRQVVWLLAEHIFICIHTWLCNLAK